MKGHVCLERCTVNRFLEYLTKYVTKPEINTGMRLLRDPRSGVINYIKRRIVSPQEAYMFIRGRGMTKHTPIGPIFVNTCLDNRHRRLNMRLIHSCKASGRKLDTVDYFCRGMFDHYLQRPFCEETSSVELMFSSDKTFADMTFYEFCCSFKVNYDHKSFGWLIDTDKIVSQFKIDYGEQAYWIKRLRNPRFYRDRFLTPIDGEPYYEQLLLKNIAIPVRNHLPESVFFSSENEENSFQLECLIQGLIGEDETPEHFDCNAIIERGRKSAIPLSHMKRILLQIISSNIATKQVLQKSFNDIYETDECLLSVTEADSLDGYVDSQDSFFTSSELKTAEQNMKSIDTRICSLDEKQKRYYEMLTKSENGRYCLLGSAGTGKSFLTRLVKDSFIRDGKNVLVCAITALAGVLVSIACCFAVFFALHFVFRVVIVSMVYSAYTEFVYILILLYVKVKASVIRACLHK